MLDSELRAAPGSAGGGVSASAELDGMLDLGDGLLDQDCPTPDGVPQVAAQVTTEAIIASWHQSMPPEIELEYVQALKNMQAMSPVQRWGVCAGSGISSKFFEKYSSFLRVAWGLDVAVETKL
eukprot:4263659-Pyramimonas_sp.AAC.1